MPLRLQIHSIYASATATVHFSSSYHTFARGRAAGDVGFAARGYVLTRSCASGAQGRAWRCSEGARPSRWQTAAPKAIARLDASRAAHGQPGLSRGHAANRLARRRLPQVQYIDSLHLAVSIFLAEALPQPPIASTSSPATASGVSPPFAGR
jgi:hypothetical protein